MKPLKDGDYTLHCAWRTKCDSKEGTACDGTTCSEYLPEMNRGIVSDRLDQTSQRCRALERALAACADELEADSHRTDCSDLECEGCQALVKARALLDD